jgi:hypothetical protein
MNNQNLFSSDVRYVFQRTGNVPNVNTWPLSYNDDGHEIRTNPATGAQLHFDEHSEIYMMQMVREGDRSLDGIVSMSVGNTGSRFVRVRVGEGEDRSLDGIVLWSVGNTGSRFAGGTIAVEGRTEDMHTLTVSECSPVFAVVDGSTTVFRIYTFGHMMKLFEEIGLREEHGPSFIFMFA